MSLCLIPVLPRWNKASDGLDMEDFAERACEFERSLLPKDLVFPELDEIWEAVREFEAPSWPVVAENGRFVISTVCFRPGDQVRILLSAFNPLHISFAKIQPGAAADMEGGKGQLSMPVARTFERLNSGVLFFTEMFRRLNA